MIEVADIRITDSDTRSLVQRIQTKRGDRTLAKTARNLIRERAQQLGEIDAADFDRLADDGAPLRGQESPDSAAPATGRKAKSAPTQPKADAEG